MRPERAALILGIGVMALSAWAAIAAFAWPLKAKLFPLVISIPLFCLAAAEVAWQLLGKPPARETAPPGRTLVVVGWILGFFAAIVLFGFPIAVALFVFLYLKLQGREGWLFSLVFTAVLWAAFYGLFDVLLHLPFGTGLLSGWLSPA
jgi:hypothetical protein